MHPLFRAGIWLLLSAHALPAVAQAPSTTVLNQPRVRIGVADGDSAYLLFGASQALRASDGRIVVLNGGSNEIRLFDPAGRHLRTLGGPGDGPGEFRMLQRIGLINGDSVAAYDIGNGRITVFAPDGRAARSATVQPWGNTVLPRALGFTRNGGMLVRTDFDRVFRPGESRDTVHLALTNAAGAPVDTLGSYAAEEAFVLVADGAATRKIVLFGRDLHASARGERVVIGNSDAFRFDVFFGAGRGRRTFRQAHTQPRVSREELQRARQLVVENSHPRTRDVVKARVGEIPHRETHPAFADLVAGSDGTIWVQHFAAPGATERRWSVFSTDGVVQRVVTSRTPFRIVDAGSDYVLAHTRDDMGVERILLFDLPPLQQRSARTEQLRNH